MPAELDSDATKRKRRKVLIVLCLVAVAAVGVVTLWPPDEPKYQGRYLSEWMELYVSHYQNNTGAEFTEAQQAVRTIGTNAVPYFLKWMRYELPPWRRSLHRKLPTRIAYNSTVVRLMNGSGVRRAGYGYSGLQILGTNAVSAMPDLEAMMRDRTKPGCAHSAMLALLNLGEPAIPAIQAVLADPHQADRDKILENIRQIASESRNYNSFLPIFAAALINDDALVRQIATNAVRIRARHLLTNAPAP